MKTQIQTCMQWLRKAVGKQNKTYRTDTGEIQEDR